MLSGKVTPALIESSFERVDHEFGQEIPFSNHSTDEAIVSGIISNRGLCQLEVMTTSAGIL